jgi:hypothetical protein
VEQEPTMCLFDEKVFSSPNQVIEHLKADHGFDIATIKKTKGKNKTCYKRLVLKK